jgi:succinate dehydrogenase/fumarate reductase flavoprotein subunit
MEGVAMNEFNEKNIKEWPYPVNYGKETEVGADVLVIGGGIAGCHAAINAARQGTKVVVVDKGATVRSGSGGAGVDHWHLACTNPCSKVTPEEMMEIMKDFGEYDYGEFGNGISTYLLCKESWDTLLDIESMGVKVRDVDDEFKGAPFRDEKTKLMFAYDYVNRYCIRVNGGADIKVAMYNECKRLGVEIFDRVMATSLLTEGGRQGARVIGATGVNVRTGEFYIFKSKAIVLSAGYPAGLSIFSTELKGGAAQFMDPNNSGEGTAMAWRAGAELALMERGGVPYTSGGFGYPQYGVGNAHNTWYACKIVDANGKEVPWVDRDGNILKNIEDRYRPAPGQKYFYYGRAYGTRKIWGPSLIPDLPERIMKGEYVLPLYADLPGMPAHERRAIWGLMIPHEGKCRIIYDTYQRAGFDPDKDLLQVIVMPPEKYTYSAWWAAYGARQWRERIHGGGLLFDWDLKTSLDGLYVAGCQAYCSANHASSAVTGRYAGRKAAQYSREVEESGIDRPQVNAEKARVYAPLKQGKGGIGWKELRAGLARIMQDYAGEYMNEETLQMGLTWLNSIKESEASSVYIRNPHELARTLECLTRITVGEIIMQASLARKASSKVLNFNRLDFSEVDPPEWNKLVTLRQENGRIKPGEKSVNYWLIPPNAPTYEENYNKHSGL